MRSPALPWWTSFANTKNHIAWPRTYKSTFSGMPLTLRINNIITDSNNLTRNIYKWYELDNEDKITFTSRNDLHHDNHNLDKHRDYQADILMSIDIIKEKCDKLSNKIKKKQSSKYHKSLTNTLDNIESSITHEIFRNL